MAEPSSAASLRPRYRFRDAWRALERLFDDPDDTAQVFEIVDALPGRSGERAYRRFAASEVGRRCLAADRPLLAFLQDREALRALPAGSLGRHYLEFVEREQLSADGLVKASEPRRRAAPLEPGPERFYARLRDMHDLWHVVTGYGRDLRGEAAVLAFDTAQTRHPGIALIVFMAWWRGDRADRRLIRAAFRRGRRAAWLPGADWEALLERPLEAVRAELRVGAPVAYEPVRSEAALAAAAR